VFTKVPVAVMLTVLLKALLSVDNSKLEGLPTLKLTLPVKFSPLTVKLCELEGLDDVVLKLVKEEVIVMIGSTAA
jgi:hypothetical protein